MRVPSLPVNDARSAGTTTRIRCRPPGGQAEPDVADEPLHGLDHGGHRIVRVQLDDFDAGAVARGRTWTETVRRLSGRPPVLPEGGELVAVGAAALAAGAAWGDDPVKAATSWGTGRGRELPALERDTATWLRIGTALDAYRETMPTG